MTRDVTRGSIQRVLTSADAVVVPEHGAVLDGPELTEHAPDLLLAELLAHHPHEDLPL